MRCKEDCHPGDLVTISVSQVSTPHERERMRSEHADAYNHDPWAEKYDADVQMSEDPIRAGYNETLDWVVDTATNALEAGGLQVEVKRFSDLSWGIAGTDGPPAPVEHA